MKAARVAVVVVHGVADQARHASVRQVADLLASVDDPADGAAYGAFSEEPLRIPVRGVPTQAGAYAHSFYQACKAHSGPGDVGALFTKAVLDSYTGEGPGATYDTIRLSTTRHAPGGQPIGVDLYEMYWADLSRVGTSAWKVLGELYQGLLHLPSLAKHAASAAIAAGSSRLCDVFQGATGLAAWALAFPIAILNVFFLVSALLVLAAFIPVSRHQLVAVSLLGVTGLGLGIFALRRLRFDNRVYSLLVLAVVALTATPFAGGGDGWASRLLGVEAAALGLVVAAAILRSYAAHRPGAGGVAVVAGAAVVAVVVWAGPGEPRPELWYFWTAQIGFRITEALFILLTLSWLFFFLASLVSIVTGWMYSKQSTATSTTPRAVRTARVALAIPAAGFLLITVALWSGVYWAFGADTDPAALPADASWWVRGAAETFKAGYTVSNLPYIATLLPNVANGHDFVQRALTSSLGEGFALSAVLLAVGAVLTLIPLVPVVAREVIPPRAHRSCDRDGRWLTEIFGLLRLTGALLVLGVLLLPVSQYVAREYAESFLGAGRETLWYVQTFGVAVAGGAVGVIAFRGRLQSLAGGFRAPVDVMLDVDGYLREHPTGKAPRARIFARFFSLLRQLAESGAYSKIVIIAHSQGTVISADLLRHLHQHGLSPMNVPVTLFTMGSPLRQLYGRRFPDMYAWASLNTTAGAQTVATAGDLTGTLGPDPAEFGLSRWVNAYRSGDYVGRWLWRSDECRYLFQADTPASWRAITARWPSASDDAANGVYTRKEFCIGAGAHTHYWDGTAPSIALELDYLIRT